MLERLDKYGREHPTLMLIVVILITALVAVPAMLYYSQGAVVLYQAF